MQNLNLNRVGKQARITFLGSLNTETIKEQISVLQEALELEAFPHEIIGSPETSFHNLDNNEVANLPFQLYFIYFSPTELDRFYLDDKEAKSIIRNLKIINNPLISSLTYYLDNSQLNKFIQDEYFAKKYKLTGTNEKLSFAKTPEKYTQNMELQLRLFKFKLTDLIKKLKLKNKKMAFVLSPVDLNYPTFTNCLNPSETIPSAYNTIKSFNQSKVTNKDISLLKEKLEENALKSCRQFSHPIIINNLLKKLAKQYGIHTIHLDEVYFNRGLDQNSTMGKLMAELYKKFLRGQ